MALIAENCRWEHDGQRYFDGEVEPCINGRTVAAGVYFGVDVAGIVERLLGEPLDDGGWNCWTEYGSVRSSFHATINVLDGLLAYEQATGDADVRAARQRGEEYLLERNLFRRKSTGEVAVETFRQFFPDPLVLRRAAYARLLSRGRRPARRACCGCGGHPLTQVGDECGRVGRLADRGVVHIAGDVEVAGQIVIGVAPPVRTAHVDFAAVQRIATSTHSSHGIRSTRPWSSTTASRHARVPRRRLGRCLCRRRTGSCRPRPCRASSASACITGR